MPFGWVCRRDGRGISIGAGWVSAVGGVFSEFARSSTHRRRGRFLLLRSCFALGFLSASSGILAQNIDRLITGGKAYFVAFFGRSFARCGIVPRSGVYPLKRRVFGVFRGVALLVCYLYKKMIDCGGGWNREGLIFLYRFFKAQKRPFEGRFLRFKNFLYIFKILCFGNRL